MATSGPDVYATGSFYQAVQAGNTALTSYGGYDGLLVKLTDAGPTGSFAWAQQAGGTGSDGLGGLMLHNGRVYVCGGMSSDTRFGALALAAVAGSANGFLASVADAALLATAPPAHLRALHVFPNPARGTATVQLPTGTLATGLVLSDALGRAVRGRVTAAAATGTAELDLTGLAPGLYNLRTTAGPLAGGRLLVN